MTFKSSLLAAATSALVATTAAPALAQFDLQITEMWMGNEPGSNLSSDWFEIVNVGDQPWQSGVDGDLFYDDESMDETTADPIMGISAIMPGEAVVVIIDVGDPVVDEFVNLWAPVYMLDGVQIGTVDGSGLGQGGDGVTLFVGGPAMDTIVDFESYPDADLNGGQSWDVLDGAFSIVGNAQDAAQTLARNDAGQAAIASPGNQGAVDVLGEAPVITLLGDAQITLALNEVFEDPGATAMDAEDGDISDDIVVGGDVVDTGVFGAYTITYDVMDADGNPAPTVTRGVLVTYPETIPPAPEELGPNLFVNVATLGGLLGAEIPSYDSLSRQAYVTSGDGLQIIDLSNPADPQVVDVIDPAGEPINLASSEVTSVDSCDGLVAFAVPAVPQTDPGTVVFTQSDGTLIRTVTVGALPDMVTFTRDCSRLLAANEGEPDDGVDPEGSISIIDAQTGAVSTADFQAFNGQEDVLRDRGVRIFPDVMAANDFEPEYIAITANGRFAYAALQEANSLALINIDAATVVDILPLGLKDHSLVGNELDASDDDEVVNIRNWPLQGMYMPDAIATFRAVGRQFIITANEGDARDADVRVSSLALDPTAFPPEEDLQNDFNIGRIQVSAIDGDTDGDGDYDVLQSYGARSFSIWNAAGTQVYDSGSDIEAIVATLTPDAVQDGRSDNKGPEPEGVETGIIGTRTFAFVGLERTDQVLVFDVSSPAAPRFAQLLQTPGDEAPEGLKFISQFASPNACPALLVTNEDSDTLTIYQASFCAPE